MTLTRSKPRGQNRSSTPGNSRGSTRCNPTSTIAWALALSAVVNVAHADVWKVTLQDARRGAHYLINTQNSTVTSMRGQQCIKSFTAKIEGASSAEPKVTVDTDLAGGSSPSGARGSQRIEFLLRGNRAAVSTSSTLRGNRAPVNASVEIVCKGAACSMSSC